MIRSPPRFGRTGDANGAKESALGEWRLGPLEGLEEIFHSYFLYALAAPIYADLPVESIGRQRSPGVL